MRVCIIGNSHIAALKLALRDGLFCDATLNFTFWGVLGRFFFDVKFENGRLISPDAEFAKRVSGGIYETIDPNEFDALVFHGPPINQTALLKRLRKRSNCLSDYSAALLRCGIESFLDDRPPIKLIKSVRLSYSGRIIASPQPLLSEESGVFGDCKMSEAERIALEAAIRDYFAGIGTVYAPQPARTISANQYTAAKYSTGSVSLVGDLDVKHPSDENNHMNGSYGAEVLYAVAAILHS